MTQNPLWDLGLQTIRELDVDTGILASAREEAYGCIFGRDSLITSLFLLNVFKRTQDTYFLGIVRKSLENLLLLQGKEVNIQSGEEPGKCIHEYRPTGHEHLTKRPEKPWYVYPDGAMRNYDTVDATPLLLITLYRYFQSSDDKAFIEQSKDNILSALRWLHTYGDANKDGFVDYQVHPERTYGGSTGHSWMDGHDSTFHEDNTPVAEPVAPVEVQGYTHLAYRLWSNYFPEHKEEFLERAAQLKKQFNEQFVRPKEDAYVICGIDGNGKAMTSTRSSIGHLLWATENPLYDLDKSCILDDEHIPRVVARLMQPDMFDPEAGIRTLSTKSTHFDPKGYHNGPFWPHDTMMTALGFAFCGYIEEAWQVRDAALRGLTRFNTPIELFSHDGTGYVEWVSGTGQSSNKKQAWAAAALLNATILK
jgi:glycogen debranching enzyme